MTRAPALLASLACLCATSSACSHDAPASPAPPSIAPAATPACDVHSVPREPRFTDATGAWNLGASGLAAVGTHLTAADLDGDGYPDLVAEAVDWNLFTARPARGATPMPERVLMNRAGPGGHRVFVDATDESGLFEPRDGSTTAYRAAELHAAADVDGDGDLDLFSGKYVSNDPSQDTGDRPEVFLNDGHGHFRLAPISDPHAAGTNNWPLTTATFVDADLDGRIDLFTAFWFENYADNVPMPWGMQAQLYRGNGDGTFTLATKDAGLRTLSGGMDSDRSHRPAYGVQACDLDGDGSPELMVAAYGRQWNLLYQNDGAGHFTEVGRKSGYAGDAIVDYHDNQTFLCWCTLHGDDANCAGAPKPAMVCPQPADSMWFVGYSDTLWQANGNSYSTSCADLDGDGDLDLYSGTIRHWWAGAASDPSQMLRNDTGADGRIALTRVSQQDSGMTWPHVGGSWNEGGLYTAAADLDSDGRQDVFVGATAYADQWSLVYHQKPDHTFEEVGKAWGIHHACAEGLAIADFDRDGDLDVVVGSGMGRDCAQQWKTHELHLYENDQSDQAGTGWLAVRLAGDGTTSNRTGIGARVTVVAGGVPIVEELGGGYGYYTIQNDTVLFFGLGACDAVDSVQVRWPDADGTVETFAVGGANRMIELRRGDAEVHEVALP